MARDTGTRRIRTKAAGGAGSGNRAETARSAATRRKLIAFDQDVLQALELLARDRMQSFQELADEAFADVLKKHGRPVSLQQSLRNSVADAATPVRRRGRS